VLTPALRLGPLPRRAALVAALVAGAVLCACSRTPRLLLRDTESRSFESTCASFERCLVRSEAAARPSGPPPEGARPAFAIHTASRLHAVCDVWAQGGSFAVNIADCRALVCASDADCPPARGLGHGTCASGLCIEPTGAVATEDAVLLCLAGTGAPAQTTRQIERFALGNSCGTPCRVPTVCRQP
jgi:hypothetical protein